MCHLARGNEVSKENWTCLVLEGGKECVTLEGSSSDCDLIVGGMKVPAASARQDPRSPVFSDRYPKMESTVVIYPSLI